MTPPTSVMRATHASSKSGSQASEGSVAFSMPLKMPARRCKHHAGRARSSATVQQSTPVEAAARIRLSVCGSMSPGRGLKATTFLGSHVVSSPFPSVQSASRECLRQIGIHISLSMVSIPFMSACRMPCASFKAGGRRSQQPGFTRRGWRPSGADGVGRRLWHRPRCPKT